MNRIKIAMGYVGVTLFLTVFWGGMIYFIWGCQTPKTPRSINARLAEIEARLLQVEAAYAIEESSPKK